MKTLVKNSETSKDSKAFLKNKLRKTVLQKRDELSPAAHKEFSNIIKDKILSWKVYQDCESLLVFVSFRSETDTYGIISDALNKGKKVYCPKIYGDDMIFYQINSTDDLSAGYMGIMEPKEELIPFNYVGDNILVLMPGSVFDKNGNRIGYGKGYYDRFLSECYRKGLKPVTAALAFSLQVVENIPAEEHDYKTDYIFTEKETLGL